jgi:uncharacterized protein
VKLQLSAPTGLHSIAAYGDAYVVVNGVRHESSVIVLPDRVLPWNVAGFDALSAGDFEMLAGLEADVVLLGTGARLRFPQPALVRALAAARIGLEVMDLQAACRTYNVLLADARKVAAALLMR